MPLFMDRHELEGLTAADIAAGHLRDLAIQDDYDVQFLNYWFDYERQHAFCLVRAPSPDTVASVHQQAHGLIPNQVIEVDQGALTRFMGGIVEHPPGEPYVETAFRTILFTDIEGSTSLTQELGDARAMSIIRAHDQIVESALGQNGGHEVKHTGDGVMASFVSVVGALRTAIEIQRQVAERADEPASRLRVRIGLAAGEPVTARDDLFGAAVQLAARLCQRARPGAILVSDGVQGLALGKGFTFRKGRPLRLKGFDEPVTAYEVEVSAGADTPRSRPRPR